MYCTVPYLSLMTLGSCLRRQLTWFWKRSVVYRVFSCMDRIYWKESHVSTQPNPVCTACALGSFPMLSVHQQAEEGSKDLALSSYVPLIILRSTWL